MKLLWHSNAPHAPTGYGNQTGLFAQPLAEHHDLAISCFYGLEGAPLVWKGIRLLPGCGQDFGNTFLPLHAQEHFGNEDGLVVTLLDVWVLDTQLISKLNVCSWVPVDHEPCLPGVVRYFKESGAVPIAMSEFGVEQLKNVGLDPLYVPHGCFDYDAAVSVPGHMTWSQREPLDFQATPNRQARLGDIVTGKEAFEDVVGVDAEGELCRAQILDRHIIPLRDSHALRVTTETGRSMVITRDNEVMTNRGWQPAGSLKVSDYVYTMDVEAINATGTTLDTGRESPTAEALRNDAQSAAADDVSGTLLSSHKDASESLGATAGWGRKFCSAISAAAQAVRGGIGLHRWDHRRRGAHFDHPGATSQVSVPSLHASSRRDESIRDIDRVACGASGLDDAWDSGGSKRLGLGVSTHYRGTRGSRITTTASALSSHQAPAGKVGHSLLRDASGSARHAFVSRGDCRSGTGPGFKSSPRPTYEPIVSIQTVQLETVYDLTTSTGNFFVDGILVHNCDTSVFKPYPKDEVRKQVGIPQDAFLIGMVAANKGRPSRKGFQQALEAFHHFHKKHSEAILYLHTVADPSIAAGEDILAMARMLGIQDSIVVAPTYRMMFDPFPPETMAQVYSAMDCLLNPSLGEGFGIPVLEAASCGVPAIVTNFSAMPQVAGPAGLPVGCRPYWTPGNSWQAVPDVPDIVDALELAYGESAKDRQARSDKARNHALDYDVKKVLKDHMLPALEGAWERFEERQPLEAVAA